MSIAAAINGRLSADDAVSALVGDRIYPLNASQRNRVFPQIVYQITDEESPHHYTGSSGLTKGMVTIYATSRTYPESLALAKAIKAALNNQSGQFGEGTETVTVSGCFIQPGGGEYQVANSQVADDLLYVKEQTFLIWLPESE